MDPFAVPLDPMMMGGIPPDPMLMGGGGIDPYSMMLPPPPIAPELGPMEMLSPVPEEVEPFVPPGPKLPVWYVEPPKPKKSEIQEEASRERSDHQDRIALAMQTIRRIGMEVGGIFARDAEAHRLGVVERGWLTDLHDEHKAYCSHIAAMDWSVSVPLKDSIDREETIAKEDAIHYFFECIHRQHSAAGNASLDWALPDMVGKYGMIAASLLVDPTNEELGLRFQMVDPATVYPVFEGGMGLARVYRIYEATASQVIGSFFDAEGSVQRKVRKIATSQRQYNPHHSAEVIEYWDRAHVMVLFAGEEVFYQKHGYGKVPFKIKYAGFGQQGFTQTARVYGSDGASIRSYGSDSSGIRREDLMRIAQPFLAGRFRAHDTEESVMGLMLTAARMGVYPMWVQQLGMQTHHEGGIDIKVMEKGSIIMRDDDQATPMPPSLDPSVLNAITSLTAQNKQTGMASGVIMGAMPGGQTTGSAIDILNQAGLEKWRPIVSIIEEFLTELAEFALELWRDWGDILGMEGSYGSLSIPRRNPNPRTGDAPAHDLTPKMLRTHGIRCTVTLRRFNPHNLTQVANGLAIARNMGILDKRTIIELLGVTDNPDQILNRIDEEMLDEVPEVKQEKTLRSLFKQAQIAEKRGDLDSARDAMNRAYFIASQMQARSMIGLPADGGGLPGVPNPAMVPMLNDPALAGMPGSQGGRPPGGGAPLGPMTQPQGPAG